MDRDRRRTDANGNFRPPRKATVVKPVEKKKFVTGAQGTYELEDLPIANGNYAEVFKAREITTNVISACKVINLRRRSFSDEERDNIKTEIDILSLMQHRNIIAYVDHHNTPDRVYIFSEFAPGTTLVEYYRDNNNYVTERDSRFIFQQICDAVDYLHQRGIIHRDIKSENIMIDENLKVMVIDFGLARRASGDLVLTSLCGTVSYMAPEIDAGEESNGYTFNVDIWSIGVLLFRMLVGQYPFDDDLYDNSDKKEEEKEQKVDQGSKIDFTRDWRPFVDKQSKRSSQVKYLLETILEVDPSRRARMDQILGSDWMRMSDELLASFDKIEHSGSTRILKSNEASNSSDNSGQGRQEPWGELTITPGGFRDAPRRIELKGASFTVGRAGALMPADILLGANRAISSKQCIIERDGSGVVMMTNTCFTGTFINNLRLESMCSGQLLNEDVISISLCPGHKATPSDTTLGCFNCLKYNVTLYGAEKATPEQLVRRIYKGYTVHGSKKRRLQDESLDEDEPAWGRLVPLNGSTAEEELKGKKTIIGREKESDIHIPSDFISRKHCVIEWDAEERKAYLMSLVAHNEILVNDESFDGRLQLRHRDRIKLVSDETRKTKYEMGYMFLTLDMDTVPLTKRRKGAPVNIPVPVLQFNRAKSSPVAEEESNAESKSKVEEEEKEDKGEEEQQRSKVEEKDKSNVDQKGKEKEEDERTRTRTRTSDNNTKKGLLCLAPEKK